VTSQGSPYGRFRRALDRGNVTEAMSAAADLPHLGLTEALDFSLRSEEPERSLFARCLRRGKDLVRASYRAFLFWKSGFEELRYALTGDPGCGGYRSEARAFAPSCSHRR
jgi:hypothetical protein